MYCENHFILRFIHVDMDAFFASIEQRDNSNLKGLPVIVSGYKDKRSVVSTCSYEARKYGIKSSMPTKTAYKLCPNGIFVPPRIDYYIQVSKQIKDILFRYSDKVEMFSLDEAYLDVFKNDINELECKRIALDIQNTIFKELNLTCSLGISFTKFLSKIASDYRKPNGLTILDRYNFKNVIYGLDISKIYGIGKVTASKLRSIGVNYGSELYSLNSGFLIKKFGKSGQQLYDNIRGIGEDSVTIKRERKSFSKEITLDRDIDMNSGFTLLENFVLDIFTDIRRKNICFRTVSLKLKFYDFSLITRQITSRNIVDNYEEMISLFRFLFYNKVKSCKKVRLIGVKISNIAFFNGDNRQLYLF